MCHRLDLRTLGQLSLLNRCMMGLLCDIHCQSVRLQSDQLLACHCIHLITPHSQVLQTVLSSSSLTSLSLSADGFILIKTNGSDFSNSNGSHLRNIRLRNVGYSLSTSLLLVICRRLQSADIAIDMGLAGHGLSVSLASDPHCRAYQRIVLGWCRWECMLFL